MATHFTDAHLKAMIFVFVSSLGGGPTISTTRQRKTVGDILRLVQRSSRFVCLAYTFENSIIYA